MSKRVTSGPKFVFIERSSKKPSCSQCKKTLAGITNSRKASKTDRHVSRPYGGNLCTTCMRNKFIAQAQEEQ